MKKHGWPVGAILSWRHPRVTCVDFILKKHLSGHGKDTPDGICLLIRVQRQGEKTRSVTDCLFKTYPFPREFYVLRISFKGQTYSSHTQYLTCSLVFSVIHPSVNPAIECLSCMFHMQNPLILGKPWWIRLAFGEFWLPFPDFFWACLDLSIFIVSIPRKRCGIIHVTLFTLFSLPANFQDINPDFWGCLGWPSARLPGFYPTYPVHWQSLLLPLSDPGWPGYLMLVEDLC